MQPTEAQIETAAAFRDSLVSRADAHTAYAPLWHGWALVEAFQAGASYALSARPESGVAVPKGWKLVPVEPTAATVTRGVIEFFGSERYARDHEYCDQQFAPRIAAIYRAMLAAAPLPPGGDDGR